MLELKKRTIGVKPVIKMNEGNVLIIENEGMQIDLEDDIQDGMTIQLRVPRACITMTGLYKKDELQGILKGNSDDLHMSVIHELLTENIGTKKVLRTIFSTVDIHHDTKNDYKIGLTSEDTQVWFPLSKEEWEKVVSYLRWVARGYK